MKLLLFLVAVIAVLLGAVVVHDGVPSSPSDFVAQGGQADRNELRTKSFVRTVEMVPIHNENYEAWLYLPLASSSAKPPVIIMAPFLAAQKDFKGFEAYAKRFVEEGWAVFLFDYRGFGNSEGRYRNLVNPHHQVQDYHAAIVHLVNTNLTDKVDVTRIGLWGYSYSGGHVLVTAAEFAETTKIHPINYLLNQRPEALNRTTPQLRAVVAVAPYLDPDAYLTARDPLLIARGIALGVADWVGSWFGLSVYLKVYGSPDEVAILNTPEAMEYETAVPAKPAGGWVNKVPARSLFHVVRYKPLNYVPAVKTPTLILAASKETLCPISAANEAEKLLQNGTVIKFDVGGHFDFVEGSPIFEEAIGHQIRFLREHL